METSKYRIMIIAGEPSGDLHAAGLVDALASRLPEGATEFFGCAGPAMRQARVEPVVRADDLSIVGLLEIGRALPMFLSTWRQLKSAMHLRKPDVVILVDFPEFNLKFARAARKQGAKVVYFISPQLWAWRQYRIRSIRKHVDLLLSIMPFEKAWYSSKGLHHVRYVGNPTANHVRPGLTRQQFRQQHALNDAQLVALLPGSRSKEIERILPVMIDAVSLMYKTDGGLHALIAAAGHKQHVQIHQILDRHPPPDQSYTFGVVLGQTYDLLNSSDAAAVTSGTATLEAGIIGTPMTVVYRSSAFNYRLLKPLISVEHYGLVNLIAGDRVAKELIQYELTPQSLAAELSRLLDPTINSKVRSTLYGLKDKLGTSNAAETAADAIVELLRQ